MSEIYKYDGITFGLLLKHHRERKDFTQEDLAKAIGKNNRNSIRAWENYGYLPKNRDMVLALAKALQLIESETDQLLLAAHHPQAFHTQGLVLTSTSTSSPLAPFRLWNVPHLRNSHFTGREDLLNLLDLQLSPQQPTTSPTMRRAALTQPKAIKGLGGIGKTQIAVEYAYRSFGQERYQHICWINAATETMLIASFVEIAKKIPTLSVRNETDQTEVAAAVKRWFEQCHQRWLLIFDNVEADDFSLVQTYFPQRGNGGILLTTRAHSVSSLRASSIEVEKMGVMEGTKLLLRQIERFERAFHALDEVRDDEKTHVAMDETIATTIDEAINLVLVLDSFPLALEQASAYIEETECSLIKYRQLYRSHRQKLLARGKRLSKPSATDYPASVATTWSLSFQKIEQASPAAAELLLLCAFLAPDRIPEKLITDGATYWTPSLQQAVSDEDAFNETIAELLKYSLVKRLADTGMLSIHRLVQAVQMDMIKPEEQSRWAEKVIRAVNDVFPDKPQKTTTWPLCQLYLDQVQACNTLMEDYTLSFVEAANLLNRAGLYIEDQALYTIAEPLYQRAISLREQLLGENHLEVATSLNNLASLYVHQGRYTQAKPLYERALSIYQEQLGVAHPYTAGTFNNLASLYEHQGNYMRAESLRQEVLVINEQVFGPDHLEIATDLNNLAHLYVQQGKYTLAEPLYTRALAIQEQHLETNHPNIASTLNNLAFLHVKQGNYSLAEPLYERALSLYKVALGTIHPNIASILNNLASLYEHQGNYTRAESLYQEALVIDEQIFGPDHLEVATNLNNLASLYVQQGKYTLAEPLYTRALAIQEQHLETNHPNIASTLNNLAFLHVKQGNYSLAGPLYERALSLYEQIWGIDHLNTASALNNLASLYVHLGNYALAEQFYGRVISIYEQQVGDNHPNTARSLSNLAAIYHFQKKYDLAESRYQRALKILEVCLGIDHPSVANTLNSLATLYNNQGNYNLAEPLYQRALTINEQKLGPQHPNTRIARENYITLLQATGRDEEASTLEAGN